MLPKLVRFVVGGAQKGGTTALDAYLKEHPEIEMPTEKKELHFFDRPGAFNAKNEINNPKALRRYHRHFAWGGGLAGEVTPTYMYFPECAPRIHKYNPDMKWIIMLRNPIDRAFSAYKMLVHRGTEKYSFSEVIRDEEGFRRRLASGPAGHTYLDRGRYSQQLRRLYGYFPEENVLLVDSSLLRDKSEEALAQVAGFLCVDAFPEIQPITLHTTHIKDAMGEEDRVYLKEYYRCEVEELGRLTGRSYLHWLD